MQFKNMESLVCQSMTKNCLNKIRCEEVIWGVQIAAIKRGEGWDPDSRSMWGVQNAAIKKCAGFQTAAL